MKPQNQGVVAITCKESISTQTCECSWHWSLEFKDQSLPKFKEVSGACFLKPTELVMETPGAVVRVGVFCFCNWEVGQRREGGCINLLLASLQNKDTSGLNSMFLPITSFTESLNGNVDGNLRFYSFIFLWFTRCNARQGPALLVIALHNLHVCIMLCLPNTESRKGHSSPLSPRSLAR